VTEPFLPTGPLGFEAFGTACGLAVVAGALSVVAPTCDALTVTLVALAVAGWGSLHRRDGRPHRRLGTGLEVYAGPFALLAVAVGVYLDPPGTIAAWRAFVLGLAVVPLWVVERRSPPPRSGGGGRP